jgi:hypothetical protein
MIAYLLGFLTLGRLLESFGGDGTLDLLKFESITIVILVIYYIYFADRTGKHTEWASCGCS